MCPSEKIVAQRFLVASNNVESPLDGKSRRGALEILSVIIHKVDTKGVFYDAFWQPVNAIWKALDRAGIPFAITKSVYEKEPGDEIPTRKIWRAEVSFLNDHLRETTVYIHVTAAGLGRSPDPLASYDVVAYVSA